MPVRVQRKRTKGWKMPPNTVSVTRPSKWGNPSRIGLISGKPQYNAAIRSDDCEQFREWLLEGRWHEEWGKPPTVEEIQKELKGKNLACFCPLDEECHADVLLEIANRPS